MQAAFVINHYCAVYDDFPALIPAPMASVQESNLSSQNQKHAAEVEMDDAETGRFLKC